MRAPVAFVVEDDPDISRIIGRGLEAAGFEVEIIADGGRALALLAEHRPSLVVLDINLPHVAGDVILRQFSADMRLLDTRVMIVTANAEKARYLEDKADLVLVKPVTFTQIRDFSLRLVPSARLKQDWDK